MPIGTALVLGAVGNTMTCTLQGFFFIFGSTGTFLYNGALCVFYTATIAFSVDGARYKRRFELVSHLVPIIVALSIAIYPLPLQMYNLTEGSAWCTIKEYPYYCVTHDFAQNRPQCVRGREGIEDTVVRVIAGFLTIDLVFISACLILVCIKVYTQKRQLDAYIRQTEATNTTDSRFIDSKLLELKSRNTMTRTVTLQSVAYVVALFLAYILPIMNAVNLIPPKPEYQIYKKMSLVFQPIQGFFNFLIFVGGKVAAASRRNPELSLYRITKGVLNGTNEIADDMVVFTGINFALDENGQLEPSNVQAAVSVGTSFHSSAWEGYNSNQGSSDNVQTNSAGLSTMVGENRVTPEGQSEAQLSISVSGGDNNSSSNSAVQLSDGLSMPSSSNPTDDGEGGNSRRPPPRRMFFRRGNIGDPGNNNSRSVVSSSAGGASGGSRELSSEVLSMSSSSFLLSRGGTSGGGRSDFS